MYAYTSDLHATFPNCDSVPCVLQVVFRGGEGALQVLPPLIDVIPEARLNLVIYYLRQGVTLQFSGTSKQDKYLIIKIDACRI